MMTDLRFLQNIKKCLEMLEIAYTNDNFTIGGITIPFWLLQFQSITKVFSRRFTLLARNIVDAWLEQAIENSKYDPNHQLRPDPTPHLCGIGFKPLVDDTIVFFDEKPDLVPYRTSVCIPLKVIQLYGLNTIVNKIMRPLSEQEAREQIQNILLTLYKNTSLCKQESKRRQEISRKILQALGCKSEKECVIIAEVKVPVDELAALGVGHTLFHYFDYLPIPWADNKLLMLELQQAHLELNSTCSVEQRRVQCFATKDALLSLGLMPEAMPLINRVLFYEGTVEKPTRRVVEHSFQLEGVVPTAVMPVSLITDFGFELVLQCVAKPREKS